MGASSNVFANELQQQENAQGISATDAAIINGLVGNVPQEMGTALVVSLFAIWYQLPRLRMISFDRSPTRSGD